MARWEPDALGRLAVAALELFSERGYDETTVAEIAERAGLTKRTFFRYFADKREVLFADGGGEFQRVIVEAVGAAPPSASPLEAVAAGLEATGAFFEGRREFAITRHKVIAANPELQERERMKLASLAEGIAAALRERGVSEPAATLAAEAGASVFHVAFARWVSPDGGGDLVELIRESLSELRNVAA
jgi:AcrR family transcriptional regulator